MNMNEQPLEFNYVKVNIDAFKSNNIVLFFLCWYWYCNTANIAFETRSLFG